MPPSRRRSPPHHAVPAPNLSLDHLLKAKSGLTLHRLQLLDRLNELGSPTKVARGRKNQAANLAHQIAELEDFFGFPLTYREGNRVLLTEEGNALASSTREFLRAVESVLNQGRQRARTYRLGAGESLLRWIVIPRLGKEQYTLRDFSFSLSNLQNSDIVLALQERRLDFGLVRKEAVAKSLESSPLGEVHYALCVPPALLSKLSTRTWEAAVTELPLAVHLETAYIQSEFEHALNARGIRPNIRLRCDTFPNAMAALQSGAFATFMIDLPGQEVTQDGTIVLGLPCLDHTAREIHLCWHPRLLANREDARRVREHLATLLRW